VYFAALAIPLGGLVYFWLRHRSLHARIGGLATELEQRTTELKTAQQTLGRLAGLDAVTSLANHSAF
jgi:PleD family two-component response regulator